MGNIACFITISNLKAVIVTTITIIKSNLIKVQLVGLDQKFIIVIEKIINVVVTKYSFANILFVLLNKKIKI